MAWRPQHETRKNLDLIQSLKGAGILRSEVVERAMTSIDRGHYCRNHPYMDAPQSIGFDVTISAPHMHAYALELLKDHLVSGGKALDVGSGSGYLTACMAIMMGESGVAYGIESIPELVEISKENIERDHPELLSSGRVQIQFGDGKLGIPEFGPYNAIHVGAAAEHIPQALVEQLKIGGRMVIPVGHHYMGGQLLEQIDKLEDGTIERLPIMDVLFVPLTD